jgi:hypothetical protein
MFDAPGFLGLEREADEERVGFWVTVSRRSHARLETALSVWASGGG